MKITFQISSVDSTEKKEVFEEIETSDADRLFNEFDWQLVQNKISEKLTIGETVRDSDSIIVEESSKNIKQKLKLICNKQSMKSKILYLVILIGLTFASCKKDECSVEENNKGLISKILKAGVTTTEYTYQCSGLLSEVRTRYSYYKYIYNSGDLLEKRESYDDPNQYNPNGGYGGYGGYGYAKTEWTDPKEMKLSATELFKYHANNQLESYIFKSASDTITIKFNYNGNGFISKQTYYSEDSKPENYTNYTYDESGNMIEKSRYTFLPDGTTYLRLTSEYEFDQMHNPFLVLRKMILPGTSTNQNNITKETHTFYGQFSEGSDSIKVTNHIYEYNELGYPIKMDNDLTFEYN